MEYNTFFPWFFNMFDQVIDFAFSFWNSIPWYLPLALGLLIASLVLRYLVFPAAGGAIPGGSIAGGSSSERKKDKR